MNLVISGGNSFLGVNLCQLLVKEGHNVTLFCRKEPIFQKHISNVSIIKYDSLSEIRNASSSIGSIDVFIHLAWAGTGHEGRNNVSIQNENIEYSLLAIQVAKEHGCKLFVEAGSQAEYGFVSGKMTEETPCNPENEYGRAKLEFGKRAEVLCRQYEMKFIHLRILSLFGEKDHPWTLVMSSIRKMMNNEDVHLSSCEQLWNFTNVEDASKQIYLLCNNALSKSDFKSEIYLICSNDTRKLRSFVEEIKILTKSSSRLIYGEYQPDNVVSLDPSTDKTSQATGGFISETTFGQVVNRIIDNYKNGIYD